MWGSPFRQLSFRQLWNANPNPNPHPTIVRLPNLYRLGLSDLQVVSTLPDNSANLGSPDYNAQLRIPLSFFLIN